MLRMPTNSPWANILTRMAKNVRSKTQLNQNQKCQKFRRIKFYRFEWANGLFPSSLSNWIPSKKPGTTSDSNSSCCLRLEKMKALIRLKRIMRMLKSVLGAVKKYPSDLTAKCWCFEQPGLLKWILITGFFFSVFWKDIINYPCSYRFCFYVVLITPFILSAHCAAIIPLIVHPISTKLKYLSTAHKHI